MASGKNVCGDRGQECPLYCGCALCLLLVIGNALGYGAVMNTASTASISRLLTVLACLTLGLTSCRTMPPPLSSDDIEGIRSRFEPTQPVRFDSRQTLMFEFRPHWWWPTLRFAALGYASVDRTTGNYAVVCLSPLGMKLFDVARSNGDVHCNFAIPVPGPASQAIGADLSDLFFDLTPPPTATVLTRGDELVFRSAGDRRTTEYVFSIASGQLLRKVYYEGQQRIATITFRAYHTAEGQVYPRLSTLENHRYHYTLTIAVRSLSLQPQPLPGRTP